MRSLNPTIIDPLKNEIKRLYYFWHVLTVTHDMEYKTMELVGQMSIPCVYLAKSLDLQAFKTFRALHNASRDVTLPLTIHTGAISDPLA